MSNNEKIINEFKKADALLKGHFILSSGLHSDTYLQCALIMRDPQLAEKLLKELAEKVLDQFSKNDIDLIVSPAMGGVIVGYELARQLGKPAIFCERQDGQFTFRRGFKIEPGQKILVVEDVITTGKSSKETFDAITASGGNIIGEACLINRSSGELDLGVPVISLADIQIRTFDKDNVPEELRQIEAVKPGSRFLKA
jgi:orotate phosphoribosyltransferase